MFTRIRLERGGGWIKIIKFQIGLHNGQSKNGIFHHSKSDT